MYEKLIMKSGSDVSVESEVEDGGESFIETWKLRLKEYVGIAIVILSALFYSMASLIVKLLPNVSSFQIVSTRYIGMLLFSVPIAIYRGENLFPKEKKKWMMLLTRSLVGCTGGMTSFFAFQHMHLGDASALCTSTPLFVGLISWLCLKEQCNWMTSSAVAISLTGVVLISRPEFLFGSDDSKVITQEGFGVVSALLSALCKAVTFIALSNMQDIHFSVTLSHLGLFGTILPTAIALTFFNYVIPQDIRTWFLFLLSGILGFIGQTLLTLSFSTEKAVTVATARTTDILFSFLYEIFIFHSPPTMFSAFGALLIVLSVIVAKLKPKSK